MSEKNDKKRRGGSGSAVIREALRCQLANRRRGTKARKTRSETSGGGKKPWRQKGTGRARQGSIRAAQWRGGGRAFGSSRRNYQIKMNRKARRLALRALLAAMNEEGRLKVAAFSMEKPSTKRFVEQLQEKGLEGKLLLIYGGDLGETVRLSARNLPNVRCLHVDNLNPRDLMEADSMVMGENDRKKIFGEAVGQ